MFKKMGCTTIIILLWMVMFFGGLYVGVRMVHQYGMPTRVIAAEHPGY